MRTFLYFLFFKILFLVPSVAFPVIDLPVKVSGRFLVTAIENNDDGTSNISFRSTLATGRFDILVIRRTHRHFKIEKGANYKISAEIVKEEGETGEASQLLVFLVANDSTAPVWLLSEKYAQKDLRGASYIEMHSPTSDYILL